MTVQDHQAATHFYQRSGFRRVAVRPGAVDEARRGPQPEIPEVGSYGIPMRDELVLERPLP